MFVAEVRRLGCRVAHASFDKLIIVTTKTDADVAREYVSFVLSTIGSHDIFQVMEWNGMDWNGMEWNGIE